MLKKKWATTLWSELVVDICNLTFLDLKKKNNYPPAACKHWKCHVDSEIRVPGLESCIRDTLCCVTSGSNLPLLTFCHLNERLRARVLKVNYLSSNPALQFHKSPWASSSSVSRENKSSNTTWDRMGNKRTYIRRALRTVCISTVTAAAAAKSTIATTISLISNRRKKKEKRSQCNHQKAR